jgi:uncharacterized protein YaeQ
MALKATIYKVNLQMADMDRNYYEQHTLTLAQHPSETAERLMIRLLAFAIYANEALTFGNGISDGEPALWQKDLTGEIELWIELGQPEERTIRKACGRAKQVVLFLYGASGELWWKNNQNEFIDKKNLTVIQLAYKDTQALAAMLERSMELACNIQDGQVSLSNGTVALEIAPVILYKPL